MMFCPMCGAPNEDDSVYCGNCGAALVPEAEAAEGTAGGAQAEVEPELEAILVEVPNLEEPSAEPPAPPLPTPRTAAQPTSGLAITSFLLGIGGLTILPLFGSILAVILGYMARSDIRRRSEEVSGDGLALAGIIMGWIPIGVSVVILALTLLGLTTGVCGFGLCSIASGVGN